MKKLILLLTFALFIQFVKGAKHANSMKPVGKVTCHNNLTVDITISNVTDLAEWTTTEWRIRNSASCQPTFHNNRTVTYDGLALPDCAFSSQQLSNGIKYIIKINAQKSDPGDTGLLYVYDHLYYVSCEYDSQNKSVASFVPIKNSQDNDSSTAFFTFKLEAFYNSDFTGEVPNPVELGKILYFKATVDTQSDAPNLDLYPVRCWSSKSPEPDSLDGNITLIENGCGNKAVSEDISDSLSYTCKDDSVNETFSIRTFRYYDAEEDDPVYFHCDLRVCLADVDNSTCQCPTVADCSPDARKRRSLPDKVDETKLYHTSTGPFIFKNDEEEEEEEDGGEPRSFPTNLAVTVTVSGVAALAIICATAYLIVRNCSKRRQHGDLNVAA